MITGAGRGIGRGIALRLGAEGASVCIADLDQDGALSVAAEITDAGGKALAVACDVGERNSVRSAVEATASEFGRLDVLFNNAGISQTKHFMDVTEEEFNGIMRVNGLGVMICMQEAARQMQEQGGGKIVNTASVAGKEGYPLFAPYCASKFAVIALTHAGARALAPTITVNAFCPGVVQTELWEQLDREFMDIGETERPGQSLEEFGAGILAGRLSTPDDISGLAVFLASEDSDYITGQAINVDGGMVFH
jgi:meso-butanediol dehydrogenase/(S,S)-butanediol dehydrogenase/diacetyl reductase